MQKVKIKMTETDIKKQIKEYLTLKGWFHFPLLQGIGSYKGLPDIIACKSGQVLFIEVKTETGEQTEYQKLFQERIEETGCKYLLVSSLENLIQKIDPPVYDEQYLKKLRQKAKKSWQGIDNPDKWVREIRGVI